MQNTRDEDRGLKLPSKALEVLGEELETARHDVQIIGMRENLRGVIQPLLGRWNRIWESPDGETEGKAFLHHH